MAPQQTPFDVSQNPCEFVAIVRDLTDPDDPEARYLFESKSVYG